MNYLAHSLNCLDDPYEVAGAAVPDWLCLTRPRLRCRSRQAAPYVQCDGDATTSIARGVMRHHADDDWFHQTAAFGDLTLELARQIRRITGDADGLRPSFLGHILVELLLDATLIEESSARAARYYGALAMIDPAQVAASVSEMTGGDGSALTGIITRFCELQFLYDYLDDERLVFRLNQVMRRVRLAELPHRFGQMLPFARGLVAAHRRALLTPPEEQPQLPSLATLAS